MLTGPERPEEEEKLYSVWVGEEDRVASFHLVESYQLWTFSCHDDFIRHLRRLQERGFRFQ